jgi:hypothetical protein
VIRSLPTEVDTVFALVFNNAANKQAVHFLNRWFGVSGAFSLPVKLSVFSDSYLKISFTVGPHGFINRLPSAPISPTKRQPDICPKLPDSVWKALR